MDGKLFKFPKVTLKASFHNFQNQTEAFDAPGDLRYSYHYLTRSIRQMIVFILFRKILTLPKLNSILLPHLGLVSMSKIGHRE